MIIAVVLAAAVLAGGRVASRWSNYHAFKGSCLDCHLTVPGPDGPPGAFRRDISAMCLECHEGVKNLSHPVDIRPSMAVPAGLPLDWKGQITCATCHPAHGPGHGDFHLRSTASGQGFCILCHGDIESALHRVSIGAAHSGTAMQGLMAPWAVENTLDELSVKCLSCHDAVFAVESLVESRGPLGGFYHNTMGIGLSHPIGVSYIEARMKSPGAYRPLRDLPDQIKLFGGLVGCGSCHNPYSKQHDRLVMSNERSALCMACHLK
ncbi:MAG: cytochrome c3 family protein [Thermodesulfobacteriota bacterium]